MKWEEKPMGPMLSRRFPGHRLRWAFGPEAWQGEAAGRGEAHGAMELSEEMEVSPSSHRFQYYFVV